MEIMHTTNTSLDSFPCDDGDKVPEEDDESFTKVLVELSLDAELPTSPLLYILPAYTKYLSPSISAVMAMMFICLYMHKADTVSEL